MSCAFTDGKTKLSQIEDRTGQLLASLKLGDDNKSPSLKPVGNEGRRGRSAKSRRTARRLQQILDEHLSPKSNEEQLMMSDTMVYDQTKRNEYERKRDLTPKRTSPPPEEIPPIKEKDFQPEPAEKLQIENLYDKYRSLCVKEGILLGEYYPKPNPTKNNKNHEVTESPRRNSKRPDFRSRSRSRSKSPSAENPAPVHEKPLTQSTPIDEIPPLQSKPDQDNLSIQLSANEISEASATKYYSSQNAVRSPRTITNFAIPRNVGVQTRGPRTYNAGVQTDRTRLREHETQTDASERFNPDKERVDDWVFCEKRSEDKTLQNALEMSDLFDTHALPQNTNKDESIHEEFLFSQVQDSDEIGQDSTNHSKDQLEINSDEQFTISTNDYPLHGIKVLVENYDERPNHNDSYDQLAVESAAIQDPNFLMDENGLNDSFIPNNVNDTNGQVRVGSDDNSVVSPNGFKDTNFQLDHSRSDPAKSDLDTFDYFAIQFEMDKQQRNLRMDTVRKQNKAKEEEKQKRLLEASSNNNAQSSHRGSSSDNNSRRGSNNTNNSSSPMNSTRHIYSGQCHSPSGSATPHNLSPTDERIKQVAERREKIDRQRHNSALEKEAKSIEVHDKLSRRTKIPMKYFAQSVSTPSVQPKKREHHVTYNVNKQGSGIKYPNQFDCIDDVSSRVKRYTNLSERPDWVDITHKDWSK